VLVANNAWASRWRHSATLLCIEPRHHSLTQYPAIWSNWRHSTSLDLFLRAKIEAPGSDRTLIWQGVPASSNVEELRAEIITTDLSQTFRDAIAFTLSLGLGDIWIDSFYIIQDSEDWRVEAARMREVYKYAWCNIAATEAHKSGLFTDRNQSQVEVM
jgi:hypothetical protein